MSEHHHGGDGAQPRFRLPDEDGTTQHPQIIDLFQHDPFDVFAQHHNTCGSVAASLTESDGYRSCRDEEDINNGLMSEEESDGLFRDPTFRPQPDTTDGGDSVGQSSRSSRSGRATISSYATAPQQYPNTSSTNTSVASGSSGYVTCPDDRDHHHHKTTTDNGGSVASSSRRSQSSHGNDSFYSCHPFNDQGLRSAMHVSHPRSVVPAVSPTAAGGAGDGNAAGAAGSLAADGREPSVRFNDTLPYDIIARDVEASECIREATHKPAIVEENEASRDGRIRRLFLWAVLILLLCLGVLVALLVLDSHFQQPKAPPKPIASTVSSSSGANVPVVAGTRTPTSSPAAWNSGAVVPRAPSEDTVVESEAAAQAAAEAATLPSLSPSVAGPTESPSDFFTSSNFTLLSSVPTMTPSPTAVCSDDTSYFIKDTTGQRRELCEWVAEQLLATHYDHSNVFAKTEWCARGSAELRHCPKSCGACT